jgi:hypothetical protein
LIHCDWSSDVCSSDLATVGPKSGADGQAPAPTGTLAAPAKGAKPIAAEIYTSSNTLSLHDALPIW